MKKYWRLWWILTFDSFQMALINRFGAGLFLFGKIIRFGFFLFFLIFLTQKTKVLAGYDLYQTVFFFLTFNLIDTGAQLFFREIYRFRPLIVSGQFDYILARPVNPLFRVLLGGADMLDLITLPPLIIFTVVLITKISGIGPGQIILYIILLGNGLLIAAAFHIAVAALAVITTEIDHTIMIYRDLTQMARVPLDVYNTFIQGFLTFIIPVGIMMAFPVKILFGLLSWQLVIYALLFSLIFFYFSLQLWKFSLTKYSSASS